MNRNLLTKAMRRINSRLHLIVSESLISGDVLRASFRAEHLYPVGSRGDLLAHRACNLVNAVRLSFAWDRGCGPRRPRRNVQSVARNKHPGAYHCSHVYQVPHCDVRVLRGMKVADGSHSNFECLASVLLGKEHRYCGHPRAELSPRASSGFLIPVVGYVSVHIDEPW